MASIKEVVQFERERTKDATQCHRVHLWHEGSFMRAYDWSAWLMCRFVHEFKATKRQFKDIDAPVVYIGFPKTSLQKFVPDGCVPKDVEDKHTVIDLPIDVTNDVLETMRAEYAQWVEKQPLSTSQQKEKSTSRQSEAISPSSISEVMHTIMSFPVESKSPIDCMMFLAEIKAHLARLI
ncbi:hypothetical protein [Pseudoprevotella muciniphila]|nr:hypothetical protein [Pseudoprevotella muciniphila]